MKKFILVASLACSSTVFANTLPPQINALFKPYQIENIDRDVSFENNELKVVFKREKLHPDAGWSVAIHSVCYSIISKPSIWDNVQFNKIIIANKSQNQGFIFNGNNADCAAMGKLTSDEIEKQYHNDKYFQAF